jgi:hypothetical protein
MYIIIVEPYFLVLFGELHVAARAVLNWRVGGEAANEQTRAAARQWTEGTHASADTVGPAPRALRVQELRPRVCHHKRPRNHPAPVRLQRGRAPLQHGGDNELRLFPHGTGV